MSERNVLGGELEPVGEDSQPGKPIGLVQFRSPAFPGSSAACPDPTEAFGLVTCEPWPDENETGEDAALLAPCSGSCGCRSVCAARPGDGAAVRPRCWHGPALDTCIAGLYCLLADDAVTELIAADNRALRRSLSYLASGELMSTAAIDAAIAALGEQGRDPVLRKWAEWLGEQNGIPIADLYEPY